MLLALLLLLALPAAAGATAGPGEVAHLDDVHDNDGTLAAQLAEPLDPDAGAAWFTSLKRLYTPQPVPGDIKYIKCSLCRQVLHEARLRVERLRARLHPLRPDEDAIAEALEDICELGAIGEGGWLRMLDIVQQDDGSLAVHRRDVEGSCKDNCLTLALACNKHFAQHDIDLATSIYEGAAHGELYAKLCVELSKTCKGKVPRPPADAPRREPQFKPLEDYEIEMERHLLQMERAGINPYQRTKPWYSQKEREAMAGSAPRLGPDGNECPNIYSHPNPLAVLERFPTAESLIAALEGLDESGQPRQEPAKDDSKGASDGVPYGVGVRQGLPAPDKPLCEGQAEDGSCLRKSPSESAV